MAHVLYLTSVMNIRMLDKCEPKEFCIDNFCIDNFCIGFDHLAQLSVAVAIRQVARSCHECVCRHLSLCCRSFACSSEFLGRYHLSLLGLLI